MESENQNSDEGWTVVKGKKKNTKPKSTKYSSNLNSGEGINDKTQCPMNSSTPFQDWNNVVFHKRPDYVSKDAKREAVRQGNVTAVTKTKTGQPKTYDPRHQAKLENETESFHIKRVNRDFSKKIEKGRLDKNLTQKQLAFKMNVPVNIVAQYEKGTAIPDNNTIQRFQKILDL